MRGERVDQGAARELVALLSLGKVAEPVDELAWALTAPEQGGTGWAPELAKHWSKPVHVYDQEKRSWFAWHDGAWTACEPPVITARRFTGTGTRFISDDAKAAIRALFERTFGPAPR